MNESDQASSSAADAPVPGAWGPLKRPYFRALWVASFVSNFGSWMHEVGAAWLMTSLAPEPFMVALIPAAANLPIFLLALPAGALADVLDRRRLLVFTQTYLVFCAGILAGLTQVQLTGPWVLVGFTFLLAVGNALTWPAWQAITPEMVPREEVSAAIALGGISFNLARIVGPVVGGYIVGRAGSGAVFFANAVSFVAVVLALLRWKRPPVYKSLPEPVLGAVRAGVRFVRHSPAHRAILIRAAGLILCAGAFWALVPLHARQNLGHNAIGYGVLLGWFGAGAVTAGLLLPRLERRLSADRLITLASVGIGLHLVALAFVRRPAMVDLMMVLGGICWPLVMLPINISVLRLSPDWVRSRAAAIYLLVFTGSQCCASVGWGAVAERIGMANALLAAGAALVVTAPLLGLIRIPSPDEHDLSPCDQRPLETEGDDPDHHEGPVLIVIRYQIYPDRVRDFVAAMREVRPVRLRNGAMRWDLFEDTREKFHYFESFLVESWAEHLRQHERMTVTDLAVEMRAVAFHCGDGAPRTQRFMARG